MADTPITHAMDLSDALRAWLRRRQEPPEVLAAAVAYELVALIARHADTIGQAETVIDTWIANMKSQVRQLGVGVEHP